MTKQLVIDAAVKIINETMASGQASNGEGTWVNKDPLDYHARKAMLHMTALHGAQNLEAREKDEPHLKHLYNAVTRLCMAEALRLERENKSIPVEAMEEE